LFKSLRATAFMGGLRINIILPYFVKTPLLQSGGRILLAGNPIATPEDVVDAGTRFMADTRIVGRALMVGPKVKVSADNEWEVVSQKDEDGLEMAVREVLAHDFEAVEAFCARLIKLLNFLEAARGWSGWLSDMFAAIYTKKPHKTGSISSHNADPAYICKIYFENLIKYPTFKFLHQNNTTEMADKAGKQTIALIPWDPESEEHRQRLYIQRIACGWKADKIDMWSTRQRNGLMSLHWIVLDPSDPKTAERLSSHVAKHPDEATPLEDSAVAVGGRPRDSSSSRSLEPFMPIGHISIDTIASTPKPTLLLADPENHRTHLSAFYISRAIQGGGLGTATMQAAEHMAVSVLGAKVITLDTWDRRLIIDDSKKEWREKFDYYGNGQVMTFDPQGWYQRMGYKVIKEIEEFDGTSGYCLKRPDGQAWCIPSVYMEKVVE
ncbi:hypothetical protein V491_01107, partial [Pseudogymnoascus sp. VKM F-3775]